MESFVKFERFLESEDSEFSLHLSVIPPADSYASDSYADQIIDDDGFYSKKSAPQSILSPSESIMHQDVPQPIFSPPYMMQTPSPLQEPNHSDSENKTTNESDIDVSIVLSTVKKEIMEIYQSLSENNDIDNLTISSKADEAILVHMIKTSDALMTALRKTYIHANRLQDENSQLKLRINSETCNHESTPPMTSNQCYMNSDIGDKNQVRTASINMDASDNYVKRTYPDVLKSPGTVSELLHI